MSTSPSLRDNSDELFLEQNPEPNSPFSLTTQTSTGWCESSDNLFAPLPVGEFEVFYADPPWDYKGQHQHNGAGGLDTGGANRHYPNCYVEGSEKAKHSEYNCRKRSSVYVVE